MEPDKKWEIKKVNLKDLKPAEYNPRQDLKPGDAEYEKIKKSIDRFGYADLIVVNKDGTIIGGHQRWKVMLDLGYTEADVRVVDLDKNDEKALNVALNKITGAWDDEKLKEVFADLKLQDYNIEITGFDGDEINNLIGDIELPTSDDDYKPEPPEEPKSKRGDIYQLGANRVMCGDSTSTDDVAKLLGGGSRRIY